MSSNHDGYFGRWAYLTPGLFLVLVGALPFFLLVLKSFSTFTDAGTFAAVWSFEGYKDILQPHRLSILWRIARRALIVSTLDLSMAVPAAYLLARSVKPFLRAFGLFCFTVPFLASDVSRAFSWTLILGQNGLINNCLLKLHVLDQPLHFLMFSEFSVILALVSASLPFAVFPLFIRFSTIPSNVWLACDDLGISRPRELFSIAMPLSLGAAFLSWLASAVVAFGSAAEAEMLGGVRRADIVRMISDLEAARKLPAVFALSTIFVCILMLIVWWAVRMSRSPRVAGLISGARHD